MGIISHAHVCIYWWIIHSASLQNVSNKPMKFHNDNQNNTQYVRISHNIYHWPFARFTIYRENLKLNERKPQTASRMNWGVTILSSFVHLMISTIILCSVWGSPQNGDTMPTGKYQVKYPTKYTHIWWKTWVFGIKYKLLYCT